MKSRGGRPKGSPNKKEISKLIQKHANLREVVEALMEAAKGVWVANRNGVPTENLYDKDGNQLVRADGTPLRIYMVPPDPSAARILIEHFSGRPAQKKEEGEATKYVLEFSMNGLDEGKE